LRVAEITSSIGQKQNAVTISEIDNDFLMEDGWNKKRNAMMLRKLSLKYTSSVYSTSHSGSIGSMEDLTQMSHKEKILAVFRDKEAKTDFLDNSNELLTQFTVGGRKFPIYWYLGRLAPLLSRNLQITLLDNLPAYLDDFFNSMLDILSRKRTLENKTVVDAMKILGAISSSLRSAVDLYHHHGDNIENSLRNLLPCLEKVLLLFKALTSKELLVSDYRVDMREALKTLEKNLSQLVNIAPTHLNLVRTIRVARVYASFLMSDGFQLRITKMERFNPIFFDVSVFRNEGAKSEWISRFQSFTIIGEGESCSICYDGEMKKETSILSSCKHVFHTSCLQSWIYTKQT